MNGSVRHAARAFPTPWTVLPLRTAAALVPIRAEMDEKLPMTVRSYHRMEFRANRAVHDTVIRGTAALG